MKAIEGLNGHNKACQDTCARLQAAPPAGRAIPLRIHQHLGSLAKSLEFSQQVPTCPEFPDSADDGSSQDLAGRLPATSALRSLRGRLAGTCVPELPESS